MHELHSLDPLTSDVLNAAFEVSNTLGCGFLEKVYQRALLAELTLRGLKVQPEAGFQILYKGEPVGHYKPTSSSTTKSSSNSNASTASPPSITLSASIT